jgi:hypothetical protein
MDSGIIAKIKVFYMITQSIRGGGHEGAGVSIQEST